MLTAKQDKALLTALLVLLMPGLAAAVCVRELLPPNDGSVVHVSDVGQLRKAVRHANVSGNVEIILAEGTYTLRKQLRVNAPGITIRGDSTDRSKVIVRGRGMDNGPSHVFQVVASDFTVADLTAGWVTRHVIQVHGEQGANNTRIHNVRLVDAREQLLKVSFNFREPHSQSVGGIVEWSSFEFTAGHTAQAYSGGIDAIGVKDWTVRHNQFVNIRSPTEVLTGPAILFWHDAENSVIEGNFVAMSDRGIQLGLGKGGHRGGFVANNFVQTVTDVGIGLEHAVGVRVYNNSVFTENYHNSIEYRFDDTQGVEITNNLVNKRISSREGAQAVLVTNVERARREWFVNAGQGDLRLRRGYSNIVDQGRAIVLIAQDIECDPRPNGPGFDIGADEYAGAVNLGLNTEPSSFLVDRWETAVRFGHRVKSWVRSRVVQK